MPQHNNANQRTRVNLADGSFWIYEYDSLGQVKSGKRYWPDWTPVAGQQFEYTHDDIGNRTQTEAGGDAVGASLRLANYSANNLNQYTQRDVPGTNDVIGAAFATNSVTVNGVTAYRKVEYFQALAGTNNASASAWLEVNVSSGGNSVTGHVFQPKTPESFGYDADGNVTNDGRWVLTWDAENRLVAMTSLSNTPSASRLSLKFEYDSKGRRISKVVSNWTVSAWSLVSSNRLVYDGWNLMAEVGPSGSLVRSYVWGSDLSGSVQGAGGVGGLLQVNYYGTQTTNCFAAYDGNGNLTALVNAADGKAVAQYEYGPFGEVIRTTGPMAKANPFRFSTKYQDDETDLLYYGYRFYSGSTGRWLSRDPIGDRGFNLIHNAKIRKVEDNNDCLFVRNDPLRSYDAYGLSVADVANMYWAFLNELELLCACHLSCPELGWRQNVCGYWGCTRQTENLEDVFDKLKTEDVWKIT